MSTTYENSKCVYHASSQLGNKLGILSGRPQNSGLHIHPTTIPSSELGLEVSVITSKKDKYVPSIPSEVLDSAHRTLQEEGI